MIKRIWLRNYGPFKDAELRLQPLTVLGGPNASGKSTALEVLHWLRRTAKPGAVERRDDFLQSMKRKGTGSEGVEVGVETSDSKSAVWKSGEEDRRILSYLPQTVLLRLRPEAIRKASYIDSDEPLMEESGYGLPTTLAYIKLTDSESFDRLEEQTRAIVPSFEALRFKRTRIAVPDLKQEIYGDELVFDMKGAGDLPSWAVSDGTLITIGLLAGTLEYSRRHRKSAERLEAPMPSLLFLIDELERSLHPRALGELVRQLRELAERAGVQILATSHSPYLLDWLKPEEVRLTGFLEDGSATIRELADHPEFDRWKDEMTPGEIWSTVGEGWIK